MVESCVRHQAVRHVPRWVASAIAAMIDAIEAMLPDAADGPSNERYP